MQVVLPFLVVIPRYVFSIRNASSSTPIRVLVLTNHLQSCTHLYCWCAQILGNPRELPWSHRLLGVSLRGHCYLGACSFSEEQSRQLWHQRMEYTKTTSFGNPCISCRNCVFWCGDPIDGTSLVHGTNSTIYWRHWIWGRVCSHGGSLHTIQVVRDSVEGLRLMSFNCHFLLMISTPTSLRLDIKLKRLKKMSRFSGVVLRPWQIHIWS